MSRAQLYKPSYGASHALVVGINGYAHAGPLAFAANDAAAMAQCLRDQFGFPIANIAVLTEAAATKAAILRAYMRFAATESDDRIVFFFAGHGHTLPGRRETGFLIPQDGDPDDLSTLIRWGELTGAADLIPAKHMLFLMDACYGGLAVHRKAAPLGSKRFLGDILQRYARQVLAAGKPDQPVSDGGGTRAGHSIFTSHLLDGLEGAAALSNGLVTGNSVMRYVYEKVGTDAYSQQTPHFGAFDGDGDFIFNPEAVAETDAERDKGEGDDILVDVPALPDSEPSDGETLGDIVRALIPDPAARIRLDTLVNQYVRTALSEIGVNNFPATRGTDPLAEQFAVRVRRYDAIMTDLATIALLLAHWGDAGQGQLLAKMLTRLAEAERPQAGTVVWIHLAAYPVAAVIYAAGIGAMAAGRYDMLRIVLLTLVRWDRNRRDQQEPILVPVVREITAIFKEFKVLPGMAERYVPRSEHQLTALQPLVEDQLFLGGRYEEMYDQFEIMLALVHADVRGGGFTKFWGPPGRFAYEERSVLGGGKPFTAFVTAVRAQGQAWPGFAAGFFNGSLERFEEVVQGYEELMQKIGPVF